MNKLFSLSLITLLTLALASCGSKPAASTVAVSSKSAAQITSLKSNSTHYPLTIQNYTKAEGSSEWKEKEITFEKTPERILATTRTAAEFLIHLGLGDKIVGVGAVFGVPDTSVEEEFNQLTNLRNSYIGKEVAMSVDPDFIFSRGGLFDNADWGVGTVDALNDMGIKTYVMESSVTGATFDAIYTDIERIGQIFNVPLEAQRFANALRTRQETVEKAVNKISQNRTFAYLHTPDPENLSIYSAHDESFFNNMFRMLKLENVFESIPGDVSVEALIEENPDVLIALHWEADRDNTTQTDEQETIHQVLNNPKLQSLKAIKNKQVFVADYNYLFGYSYQSLDGLEQLAKQLYPEQIQE